MRQRDQHTIAQELKDWIETACAEMAYGEHGYGLKGQCEADANYENPDLIRDLLADRIHDECYKNPEMALLVLNELSKSMSHLPEPMWQNLMQPWVKRQGKE